MNKYESYYQKESIHIKRKGQCKERANPKTSEQKIHHEESYDSPSHQEKCDLIKENEYFLKKSTHEKNLLV